MDNVKPKHYKSSSGQDLLQVLQDFNLHDFCTCNAIKYLFRAGKKDASKEVEDLQKAKEYINRKIRFLKQSKNIDNGKRMDF